MLHPTLQAAHAIDSGLAKRPPVIPAVVLNPIAGNRRAGPVFSSPAMDEGGSLGVVEQFQDGLDLLVGRSREFRETGC